MAKRRGKQSGKREESADTKAGSGDTGSAEGGSLKRAMKRGAFLAVGLASLAISKGKQARSPRAKAGRKAKAAARTVKKAAGKAKKTVRRKAKAAAGSAKRSARKATRSTR